MTQTKRHSFIVSLLGIKHVLVAVNKMDLVDYSQERFDEIVRDYRDFATRLEMPDQHFIPLAHSRVITCSNIATTCRGTKVRH